MEACIVVVIFQIFLDVVFISYFLSSSVIILTLETQTYCRFFPFSESGHFHWFFVHFGARFAEFIWRRHWPYFAASLLFSGATIYLDFFSVAGCAVYSSWRVCASVLLSPQYPCSVVETHCTHGVFETKFSFESTHLRHSLLGRGHNASQRWFWALADSALCVASSCGDPMCGPLPVAQVGTFDAWERTP